MNFDITMDNIGKLKEAKLSVRPLTILAGPNNTGKSFFSKTLYSVFSTMNVDSIFLMEVQNQLEILAWVLARNLTELDLIKSSTKKDIDKKTKQYAVMEAHIKTMELISFFEKQSSWSITYSKKINELITLYNKLSFEKLNNERMIKVKDSINILKKVIEPEKKEEVLSQSFSKVLADSLISNFQVPELQKLINNKEKPASIDIKNIDIKNKGKITINENSISADFSLISLTELQDNAKVIYLESPFFWKQRNALSRASYPPFSFRSERRSLLVPKYFNDLDFMLKEELSGEMAFPDIFRDLTEKIIKGKITPDISGSLQFAEFNGKSHSLPVTATGIVQLGLLALLIEKKILDKGSILFIDEPETNLHPAWQVEIMKVLFNLTKAGARVIMATHSADMLKWLEVNLQEQDKDLVALNQLSVQENGYVSVIEENKDISAKIKSIKKQLTEPFLQLFLQGGSQETETKTTEHNV